MLPYENVWTGPYIKGPAYVWSFDVSQEEPPTELLVLLQKSAILSSVVASLSDALYTNPVKNNSIHVSLCLSSHVLPNYSKVF